jgi:hypothetical protein
LSTKPKHSLSESHRGKIKGWGAPMTLEESVKDLIPLFDSALIEKTGTFTVVVGDTLPW